MEYELCKAAQKLWQDYFREPSPNGIENMIEMSDPNLVMIGPDKQTFYTSAAEAAEGIKTASRKDTFLFSQGTYEITNEWYECLYISSDIYVVYGTLHIKKDSSPDETDFRFSIIYHVTANSYEILHIHYSIPCF